MAKGKKGSKENPLTVQDLQQLEEKDYIIIEASIKDDFCDYSYEVQKGVGKGRVHKVEGKKSKMIISDDMREAFSKMRVHLAVLAGVFKQSDIEIEDIDTMHSHELSFLFTISGFQIKGSKENESVILIGTMFSETASGRFELKTPRIALDNLSSYKWHNELKAAVDKAREEVELYDQGKYTLHEEEEDPKYQQLTISGGEDDENWGDDHSPEARNARIRKINEGSEFESAEL
jgi:hypothetical protein